MQLNQSKKSDCFFLLGKKLRMLSIGLPRHGRIKIQMCMVVSLLLLALQTSGSLLFLDAKQHAKIPYSRLV